MICMLKVFAFMKQQWRFSDFCINSMMTSLIRKTELSIKVFPDVVSTKANLRTCIFSFKSIVFTTLAYFREICHL